LMIAAALSIGDQLISQQYMTGVSTLFDAMSDPTRKGEKWLQSTVGAMVPAAVKTYTKTQDPYIHQVENLTDTILSKLPHTSDGVPYKIDLWGRKITVRSNMGELYDTFSPFRADTFEPEPIDIELESIEYFPKGMGKKQSFDGVTIDMEQHPKAWQRLKELAGNEATKNAWGAPIDPITNKGAKDSLNLIVQNKHPGYPMYQYLTPGPNGAKKRLIQNVMDLYRDAARSIILKEFPEIKAEVDASKNQSKYVFQ